MNRFVVLTLAFSMTAIGCGGSDQRGKISFSEGKQSTAGVVIKATIEDKQIKTTCLKLSEIIDKVPTEASLSNKLARSYVSDLRVLDFDADIMTSTMPHESTYAQSVLLLSKIQGEETKGEDGKTVVTGKIDFYTADYAVNFKSLINMKLVTQNDCQKLTITDMENNRIEYDIVKENISPNHLFLSNKDADDILVKRLSNDTLSVSKFYKIDLPTDCKKKDDLTKNLLYKIETSYQWGADSSELSISTLMADTMSMNSKIKMDGLPGVGRQNKITSDAGRVKIGTDRYELVISELEKLAEISCK